MSVAFSPYLSSNQSTSPPICSEPVDAALKSYFQLSSLKPYQKEVIEQILQGRDCLVVMVTGAGKSLCYQLPPLVCQKTAVVVSPLLSLMQDQVMSLKAKGVNADYLGSTQTNKCVFSNAQNGLYDVLYLTPEKARFWTQLTSHGVCLFAIDEAHCISEWGTDFRQDYKLLDKLRTNLPGVPFVALTATATERVREDIISSLSLKAPVLCIGSFDRPNLFYSVKLIRGAPSVDTFIEQVGKEVHSRFTAREPTIIYCNTIRDTEDVHHALSSIGVSSGLYHGQMERISREKFHKSFSQGELIVMVATMAFGMGIDKPDVRCVIHYGCPKSLESYYQEIGRGGRDVLPSSCILYYNHSDFCKGDLYCSDTNSEKQKRAIMNAYIAAQKYCQLGSCRRKDLLSYFGESCAPSCGNCDNCTNAQSRRMDFFTEAVLLLTSIKDCGGRWGLNVPINVLRGSNARKITDNQLNELSVHGKGKSRSVQWWKSLASILTSNGYLEDSYIGSLRIVSITMKGHDLIKSSFSAHPPLIFSLPQEMLDEEKEQIPPPDTTVVQEQVQINTQDEEGPLKELQDLLTTVRLLLAKDNGLQVSDICTDNVIASLARIRPSDRGTLSLVVGVDENFVGRYSSIFLHHIKETSDDLDLQLDNFELEEIETPSEATSNVLESLPLTHSAIKEKLGSMMPATSGICLQEILGMFPQSAKDMVVDALEEMESSL